MATDLGFLTLIATVAIGIVVVWIALKQYRLQQGLGRLEIESKFPRLRVRLNRASSDADPPDYYDFLEIENVTDMLAEDVEVTIEVDMPEKTSEYTLFEIPYIAGRQKVGWPKEDKRRKLPETDVEGPRVRILISSWSPFGNHHRVQDFFVLEGNGWVRDEEKSKLWGKDKVFDL